MTWQVGPTMLTGQCMLMSSLHKVDVILCMLLFLCMLLYSGRSTGIRVGSTHPGEEDAWGASVRVGRRLAGEWWRVRPCPTSDFDAVFTSGFVSSSSTRWYGQNTILTTFIFEQKIKHHLNHQLWYQLLGGIRRPVMYWSLLIGGKAHWDTIFYVVRKITYIHGRELFH